MLSADAINIAVTATLVALPLLSPIAPQLGLKGALNGKRVTEIVDSYLLDFFEMTLNNKPSTLFDGPFDDFSEVKVR